MYAVHVSIIRVQKPAKNTDGLKFSLSRSKLLDETVDTEGMKTRASKNYVRTFSTMSTRLNQPSKIWVDQDTRFAGEHKKLCKTERIESSSSISDTEAAIAERTMRSLRNLLQLYIDKTAFKIASKYHNPEVLMELFERFDAKACEGFRFFPIVYMRPQQEFRKPKSEKWRLI